MLKDASNGVLATLTGNGTGSTDKAANRNQMLRELRDRGIYFSDYDSNQANVELPTMTNNSTERDNMSLAQMRGGTNLRDNQDSLRSKGTSHLGIIQEEDTVNNLIRDLRKDALGSMAESIRDDQAGTVSKNNKFFYSDERVNDNRVKSPSRVRRESPERTLDAMMRKDQNGQEYNHDEDDNIEISDLIRFG
jgi:hypothetical protein